MDMRFIEVCIGLALVFALTGMLVTTLLEVYVAAMGRRGDNLELALRSLLADDPHNGGTLSMLKKGRAASNFSLAMLSHPLLVSQSQGTKGEQRRPSYLPGDLVVSALLAQLTDSHHGGARPQTPKLFVNGLRTAQAQGPVPPAELVKSLETLVQGTEGDWQAYERRLVAWFDSVAERSGGWYKRWTQWRLVVLGFCVAVAFNINPLVIAGRLWDEEPLRKAVVAAAEAANTARQADKSASAASGDADLRATRAALAALPAGARTERAAQVARQGAQAFEVDSALGQLDAAIGALVGSPRPVDLSGDGALRLEELLRKHIEAKELVRLRRSSVADHDVPDRLLALSASIDDRIVRMIELAAQGRLDPIGRLAEGAREALLAERSALMLQALPDAAASRCRQAASADAQALCEQIEGIRSIGDGGLPVGWRWENIPGCREGGCSSEPAQAMSPQQARDQLRAALDRDGTDARMRAAADCRDAAVKSKATKPCETPPAKPRALQERDTAVQKLTAQWKLAADAMRPPKDGFSVIVGQCTKGSSPCDWVMMLLGWLVVGLSAMMGAPFWFDLLGRLINLRGSGAKPADDGKTEGAASAAPAADIKGPGSGMLAPPANPAPTGGGAGASSESLSTAEAGLTAEQIVRIQKDGLAMPADLVSGRLDTPTRKKIAEFQGAQGFAPADGVLTAPQIDRLLRGVAPPAPSRPPTPPAALGSTPVRADGTIAPLNEQQIRDLYGDIETRPDPNHAGAVIIQATGKPGGPQRKLVLFKHPALANVANVPLDGFEVHELAEKHFKAVFDAIVAAGFAGDLKTFHGSAVARHIGSDPGKRLSSHTWGIAIDLNKAANEQGQTPAPAGAPGNLQRLVPIFNQHGFAWGGHFKNSALDGMHFELALRQP